MSDLSFYPPPCQRNEREHLSLWLSLLGGSLVKRRHSAERTEKINSSQTLVIYVNRRGKKMPIKFFFTTASSLQSGMTGRTKRQIHSLVALEFGV